MGCMWEEVAGAVSAWGSHMVYRHPHTPVGHPTLTPVPLACQYKHIYNQEHMAIIMYILCQGLK